MITDKNIADYTNEEVLRVFDMVKSHLKRSDKVLKLNGYKVKYIDYHIVRETEEGHMGYEDEIVYIAECFEDGKKVEDSYLGMNEKEFTVVNMRNFLSNIDRDELNSIILGNAFYSVKRKERDY